MKRTAILSCLIVALSIPAGAEFGTIIVSPSAQTVMGAYTIDITVVAWSSGAVSPAPYDWMGIGGQIYYPYTWSTAHPSFTSVFSSVQSGRTTNGGVPFHRVVNFSHSPASQIAGDWGVWTLVNWADSGATTWTGYQAHYVVDGPHTLPGEQLPTATPDCLQCESGPPVPALNGFGKAVMAALLAAIAVLVIARRR